MAEIAAIPSGTAILVEENLSLKWVAKIHVWDGSTVSHSDGTATNLLRRSVLVTSDREPHSNRE